MGCWSVMVSCSLLWDCNGSSDGYAGHTFLQAGFVAQFGKVTFLMTYCIILVTGVFLEKIAFGIS